MCWRLGENRGSCCLETEACLPLGWEGHTGRLVHSSEEAVENRRPRRGRPITADADGSSARSGQILSDTASPDEHTIAAGPTITAIECGSASRSDPESREYAPSFLQTF